MGYFTNEALFK